MTSQMSLNLSRSSLWAPYKELLSTVDAAVIKKEVDVLPELETILRIHKPNFISFLRNPVRSPLHKAALQRAPTEGIAVEGQATMQIIPQSLVDEALVISEIFDLNELTSLELLVAGQQQQPYFPGLTRGLVAVLLYYDGRRSLVNALRALVQGREGRTWTLGLNKELVDMITKYTDQLKEDGLITKILDFLGGPSVTEEVDILQKNRAIGGPRYRKQVVDMIEEIRLSLAEILLGWSCQGSLTGQETTLLLQYIAKHASIKSDGSLDSVSLTLTLAALYVMDVSLLQSLEEVDERAQKIPVVSDPDLARTIHQELISAREWENGMLLSIFQFAWSISLRTLFQTSWALNVSELNSCVEQDEKILDSAIEAGAFVSIKKLIVCSANFHEEEFFVKRIHTLVTDFIVLMPLKVKELRNQGDESARIILAHMHEGLKPPANLHRHFEHLMNLISEIYTSDPLPSDLAFEYWSPTETTDQTYLTRPPLRQVSLYKFVRLAGDLLPAPLFVPYINMLQSLSQSPLCAHQCYTMLKMNGKRLGTQSSIISWDHFFESLHQYYSSLRQEVAIINDTQHLYQQRPHSRGITPQEVDGLNAVLGLMEATLERDGMARIVIWENPQYVPGVVLIGLVGCSIPPVLKAKLLRVLSAFANSPEVAVAIWQQLEISQIIPTVKSLSVYKSSGIQMDLNEVESRMEEYSITRAALTLLSTLITHPLPKSLGAGQRLPGFDPYLQYIRDVVFLPFHTRAYKNEGERWEVGALCLQIMLNLLKDYRVSASDFTGHILELPGGVTVPSAGPPGYSLMVQLLQDSPLLKLLLQLLDEGVEHFDRHAQSSFRKQVEECTLWCLRLIHCVLIGQEEFLSQIRKTGSGLLVTSLDRLLLGVNPRSGQPDHIITITKYITYNALLPKHSYEALSSLKELCQTSQIAQHLVVAFTTSSFPFEELLYGFVECLDADVVEDPAENLLETKQNDNNLRGSIRKEVLQLILICLHHASPNLAHLLLGFQTRKPVQQTVLQDPGILNSPRTCLHAVLAVLESGCDTLGYPVIIHQAPTFAELAYKLIYVLCSNRDTTSPTLRYLRTNYDFIFRQVRLIPFKQLPQKDSTHFHTYQMWLLKTLAVELRILTLYQQRSHVQRLVRLLLDDSPEPGRSEFDVDSQDVPSYGSHIPSITGSVRRKLMHLLDIMVFTHRWIGFPTFEYLETAKIDKLISQCETSSKSGPKRIDVEKFKRRLLEELPAVQGFVAVSQRPVLAQEITQILQYVLQRNKGLETIYNKHQIFDAWRQVTEVLFTACSLEFLSARQKHQVILEICQELLARVLEEGVMPELTAPASGVVLLLTTALHYSLSPTMPVSDEPESLLTLSSSLVVVLKGVLECLMKTGFGVQRVRVNYYGALLSLLMIVHKPKEQKSRFVRSGIELAVIQRVSDSDKICKEYVEAILSFGESMMDMVCRDACSGHEVTKMSALASLDSVISLERAQHWLTFVDLRGYLRHIISSLVEDDQQLQQVLQSGSSSLSTFYVFESKLSLLIRISESRAGALALLRAGLFEKLAECSSLHMRPERDYSIENSMDSAYDRQANLPSVITSFQQIITPTFQLVQAVLTTLGSNHYKAFSQILHFIAAHAEVFNLILRDRSNLSNLKAVEELSLASAILSRLSYEHLIENVDPLLIEHQGKLGLLHQRLISLLPHSTAALLPLTDSKTSASDVRLKAGLLQIVVNILTCITSTLSFSKSNPIMNRTFFAPSLVDASSRESYFLNNSGAALYTKGYPPSLGLLVTLLLNSSEQINTSLSSKKKLNQNLESIATLGTAELNDWLAKEGRLEGTSHQHLREVARQLMVQSLQAKSDEITLHALIIENCLVLLWRHLEYFLKYCVPTEDSVKLGERNKGEVTRSALDGLKADIKSVLTDALFSKVHLVQQFLSKEHSHVDFVGIILRKLKRIVKIDVK